MEETGEEWEDNNEVEATITKKRVRKTKRPKKCNELETIEEKCEEIESDKEDSKGDLNQKSDIDKSDSKINSVEGTSNSESSEGEEYNDSQMSNRNTPSNLVNLSKVHQLQPSKLFTIKLKIKNTEVTSILDTGSDTNMISKSLAEYYKCELNTNEKRSFKGLGQQ